MAACFELRYVKASEILTCNYHEYDGPSGSEHYHGTGSDHTETKAQ